LINAEGSSPIETVALLAILLIPVGPVTLLYSHLSDSLAAESIARHGLRGGILEADDLAEVSGTVANSVRQLAASWGKPVSHRFSCTPCEAGGIAVLEVSIGTAIAMQAAGLEPN